MARPTVPPFGNWESEEVPYTIYFDNARKGKKSGQFHQTDPQENVDPVIKDHGESEAAKSPIHERISSPPRKSTGSPKVTAGHKPSIESVTRRLMESPLRQDVKGGRTNSNSPHHRYGGSSASETPKRVARHSMGSDRSNDQSPLHPHSQARVGGRSSGISSPSWERKATSEGSHGPAPSTPGRSRLRSVTRGSESPDRGPAVPKFGGWDENDPASGEGYTHIFNRVREEKHSEMGKVPIMPTDSSYSNGHKQYGDDTAKGCGCFPWGKK